MTTTSPTMVATAATLWVQTVLATSNSSSSASPFPPGLMDTLLISAGQTSPLMQLVIFVYRQLGSSLGLDPSVVLTVLGVLWGLFRLGSHIYNHLSVLYERYFTCAIYVSEHDQIYDHIVKWLSHQRSIRSGRSLTAKTVWESAWDDDDDIAAGLVDALCWTDAGDGDEERRYLNFSNQAARSRPRYVPAMGLTGFWYRGTYFSINRRKESFLSTKGWTPVKDIEEIKISCSGRSSEPIKQLLADAKSFYFKDTSRKTSIYRPRPQDQRHDRSMWQQVARRPVRSMRTVVLDSSQKHSVLSDVNEYLHPSTPRWYASRGIPLRRGYLLHGPPGTGKTSFSFALAGVFGIDIYVISLQDANISEEDLAMLFSKLPRRCIVLLEDIDSSGLKRQPDDSETTEDAGAKPLTNGISNGGEQENPSEVGGNKEKEGKNKKKKKMVEEEENKKSRGQMDSSTTRQHNGGADGDSDSSNFEGVQSSSNRNIQDKGKGSRDKGRKSHGISLSGLLNAIDGVASHEGRILIMTTNKPESLDEALIRPGRVDVQVAFVNASSKQAGQLFRSMYEAAAPRQQARSWSREGTARIAMKTTTTTTTTTNRIAIGSTEVQSLVPPPQKQQMALVAVDEELDVSSSEELTGCGGRVWAAHSGRQILTSTDPGLPAEAQEESAPGARGHRRVGGCVTETEGGQVEGVNGAVSRR